MPHVMSTSHRVILETGNDENPSQLSFMEKVRQHVDERRRNNRYAKYRTRALFVFHAVTQLYTTVTLIIPHVFQNYNPWTQYYIKVIIYYLFVNIVANWLCFLLYDTSYRETKDTPEYDVSERYNNNPDKFEARLDNQEKNGYVPTDSKHQDLLAWKHCSTCKMNVPPRAHHCNVCNNCILKRDHHCLIFENCVGFKNQRYFIILSFYSAIVCISGSYFTVSYLCDIVWHHSRFSDFLLPVTFYRLIFGNISISTFLLIYHSYTLIPLGAVSAFSFVNQVFIVAKGVTLYEFSKKAVRCTRPINENFKSVFGDFWGFNFLFPAQILFRQQQDGKTWEGIKINRRRPPLSLKQ